MEQRSVPSWLAYNLTWIALIAVGYYAYSEIEKLKAAGGCATCPSRPSPYGPVSPYQPYQPPAKPLGDYRLSPDGFYWWRYQDGRVIGRWNPVTGVYESWDGTRWNKAAPPIGDLKEGK
jgi:hypothetical protein